MVLTTRRHWSARSSGSHTTTHRYLYGLEKGKLANIVGYAMNMADVHALNYRTRSTTRYARLIPDRKRGFSRQFRPYPYGTEFDYAGEAFSPLRHDHDFSEGGGPPNNTYADEPDSSDEEAAGAAWS